MAENQGLPPSTRLGSASRSASPGPRLGSVSVIGSEVAQPKVAAAQEGADPSWVGLPDAPSDLKSASASITATAHGHRGRFAAVALVGLVTALVAWAALVPSRRVPPGTSALGPNPGDRKVLPATPTASEGTIPAPPVVRSKSPARITPPPRIAQTPKTSRPGQIGWLQPDGPRPNPPVVVAGPRLASAITSRDGEVEQQRRIAEEAIAARLRAERDLGAARERLAAERQSLERVLALRHAAEAIERVGRRVAAALEARRDVARTPAVAAGPARPKTATIEVRMPSASAELVVKGEVGKGNPDEWYGPDRTIHTPPMPGEAEYLVGAFWKDASGQPRTRTCKLAVRPGLRYEVDLRPDEPTSRTIDRR